MSLTHYSVSESNLGLIILISVVFILESGQTIPGGVRKGVIHGHEHIER